MIVGKNVIIMNLYKMNLKANGHVKGLCMIMYQNNVKFFLIYFGIKPDIGDSIDKDSHGEYYKNFSYYVKDDIYKNINTSENAID